MSDKHIEMQENEPIVYIKDWEEQIKRIWDLTLKLKQKIDFENPNTILETGFLSLIWKMSQEAFDIPREIQVVVDKKDNLFMDVGTPGHVEFNLEPVGMELPIKCWIHTHPFGRAYFSQTDWRTINTMKPIMKTAVVLGDNQYWAYHLEREVVKTVQFARLISPEFKEGEEE